MTKFLIAMTLMFGIASCGDDDTTNDTQDQTDTGHDRTRQDPAPDSSEADTGSDTIADTVPIDRAESDPDADDEDAVNTDTPQEDTGTPDQDMESDSTGDATLMDTPFDETGDTNGDCSAPIAGQLVINEVLASPATGDTGDSNCDGTRNGVDDEFIELVNATYGCLDISGVTITKSGSTPLSHQFAAEVTLPAGAAIVVFGGPPGGSAVFDGTSGNGEGHCVDLTDCEVTFQLASAGALAFSNAEETITVALGDTTLDEIAYGGDSGLDGAAAQSLVRDPDITGSFTPHLDTSSDNAQSPGTRLDATPFVALDGCSP